VCIIRWNWFFVTFGDYIYIKPTFLFITTFSIKFPVNIRPGSWSFLFSLLITKYEISPKVTKNLPLCHPFRWYRVLRHFWWLPLF
jgi:hypothetical protein